jgi:hypothetical protein
VKEAKEGERNEIKALIGDPDCDAVAVVDWKDSELTHLQRAGSEAIGRLQSELLRCAITLR